MKMMRMCLNWKVLAGLAAVGVGIYLIAPDLVVASLPILLLAACPLSMLLMMKGMHGDQNEAHGQRASQEADAGLTREQQITRLRWRKADLDNRIKALEQEEPQRPRDGRER